MTLSCRVEMHLEKIARTIAGKPAHFELVTKDQLYMLKPGDLILSADGLIEDDMKYKLEFGAFYSLFGNGTIQECFLQQKGVLNFAKDDLSAYRPSALFSKEAKFIRRPFIEPEFRTIQDYYRLTEIIQQKAMLKMIYD